MKTVIRLRGCDAQADLCLRLAHMQICTFMVTPLYGLVPDCHLIQQMTCYKWVKCTKIIKTVGENISHSGTRFHVVPHKLRFCRSETVLVIYRKYS